MFGGVPVLCTRVWDECGKNDEIADVCKCSCCIYLRVAIVLQFAVATIPEDGFIIRFKYNIQHLYSSNYVSCLGV